MLDPRYVGGDGPPRDRRRIPPQGRPRPLLRLPAALIVLLVGGCSGGVLDPQGPIGAANRLILLNALGIMLVIVVPTIIAILIFAWWFRASNTRASYRPDFVYSGGIEMVVWGIPILTIMFLGGVTWIGSHDLDPFKPIASPEKPVEVQVVSLDWKWLFIYPDESVASVNELVVPAEVPVHFSLTSASVMNMFFVPQLGTMIATMNGMDQHWTGRVISRSANRAATYVLSPIARLMQACSMRLQASSFRPVRGQTSNARA
jgi:cytochrome o ubiquinol oxidase subunit II